MLAAAEAEAERARTEQEADSRTVVPGGDMMQAVAVPGGGRRCEGAEGAECPFCARLEEPNVRAAVVPSPAHDADEMDRFVFQRGEVLGSGQGWPIRLRSIIRYA
eukprot:4620776-Pyramimonas_sp.AAC.1